MDTEKKPRKSYTREFKIEAVRLNRVGGDFCGRPLSHHRTCFIASGGSPKNRQSSRVTASCLGHFLASAGEGSALWPNPDGFTAFAQPVVPPFGVFCLHRLSHEPLKFLPSSTFGPSRHLCADTMTSADSCRLSPTSQPGLPSEDGLAAGLPR